MSSQNTGRDQAVSRRGLLKRGGIVTGLAAIVPFIDPLTAIHATTTSQKAKAQVKTLQGTEAKKYLQAVLRSPGYQSFKEDLSQKYGRSLTIFEGVSLTISTSLGGLCLPASGESVHIIATKDGIVVLDEVVTPENVSSQMKLHPEINLGCFEDCLNSQGISWAAIAIFIGLCSLACAVVVTVCIPCAVASIGAPASVIAYCWGKCPQERLMGATRKFFVPI
jgi:hypothetical protein